MGFKLPKGGNMTSTSSMLFSAGKRIKDALQKIVSEPENLLMPQVVQNVVPLNVRAFASDLIGNNITGRHSEINESHLNENEKLALTKATKTAESKGRNYIEYDDYNTGSAYNDVGGGSESALAPITKFFNPNYSMKTTFGQMGFKPNEDGSYTYTDQYNFNDANTADSKEETFLEGAKAGGKSVYGQARNIATHYGSGSGSGSKVNITY